MSSLNDYIKFALDIEDHNIVFRNYFYADDLKSKIYEAELIQPACHFCGSVALIHNGHLKTNIRYITANASYPVTIRLLKQRVKCRDCSKRSMAQSSLVNTAVSLILPNQRFLAL